MNLQFYLEKLFASEEFEKFLKEKPEAYFCSGFFCIDKKGSDNKAHIDYYVPSENKIFSFQLESKIEPMPVEQIGKNLSTHQVGLKEGCTPKNIPENIFTKGNNIDFDFEEIEKMIKEKITEEKINSKIEKILLSLQRLDGKDFLVGTIFVSGLGMIKIKIDLAKMEIVEFEKKSFFDMMKVMKK